MANKQQRRRGNAATTESRARAYVVGETRRCVTRPVHGYEEEDVRRARNPQLGRQVYRWRAVIFEGCVGPARGSAQGKASEPVPKQPFASTSRRPPSARSFGVQGARWSSSPGTGMNAASGAQRGDSQRWGHVGQTLRGPAPDRFAGCGEAGSPTLPQSRASASRGVAFGRCRTPVIPGGGRSRSPREGREGSAVDDLGRRSA